MEIVKKIFYIVYKITNLINNKIYIGVHKTLDIDDNYMGSGSLLIKDINKLNVSNFSKEILFIFDNKEDMLSKESELVNKYFIKDTNTYNIMLGGGFFCGELTKDTIVVKDSEDNKFRVKSTDRRYLEGELIPITKGYITVKDKEDNKYFVKISDENYLNGTLVPMWKGNKKTQKSIDNITGIGNPFYGRKHSDETKLKISTANKLNIGELNSFYGKKHSDETKLKLSLIGKELYESGKNIGFTGRKHSDETKNKMSLKDRSKENNSQFGTCWINNIQLMINKKIKKEELEIWINNGWIKGMNKKYFKNNTG